MSHFVNTFFDIFVKILYAIRTIIAKSRKLQGFLYTDSLHGAHFLTTEAGDAAFSLEFRLAIFDSDDMCRTAFRTFSACLLYTSLGNISGFQRYISSYNDV